MRHLPPVKVDPPRWYRRWPVVEYGVLVAVLLGLSYTLAQLIGWLARVASWAR